MNGIVFLKTQNLDRLTEFYINQIGCGLWLEQADCRIFKHGNLLLGFCNREQTDTCGIITFFYATREEVDRMFSKFKSIAISEPKENEKYQIYNFFAKDPDGRMIEFQWFMHEVGEI